MRNELAKFYGHLLYDDERSVDFLKKMLLLLNDSQYYEIQFYERIISSVMNMDDRYRKERTETCFKLSMKIIENNKNDYAFMDNLTGMLIKFAKRNTGFREYFYSDKSAMKIFGTSVVDRVNRWLKDHSQPPIQSLRSTSAVFKDSKRNNRFSYDIIIDELDTIKEYNQKRKAELKSMYKKIQVWEDPDLESEDDLFEENLRVGSNIDFEDNIDHQWYSGKVITNLGNIIKIVKINEDEMEVDGRHRNIEEHWLNRDTSDIAPYQSKTRSARAKVLSVYNRAFWGDKEHYG